MVARDEYGGDDASHFTRTAPKWEKGATWTQGGRRSSSGAPSDRRGAYRVGMTAELVVWRTPANEHARQAPEDDRCSRSEKCPDPSP